MIIGRRRTDLLAQIQREHPGIETVQIDTTDPVNTTRVARRALADHPDLNVLVTMAGIMRLEDWTSPDGFLESAQQPSPPTCSVRSGLTPVHRAPTGHARCHDRQRLLTARLCVPEGHPEFYNTTEAAIHMLSESQRLQLADGNVKILGLEPPAIQMDLLPDQAENPHAMPLDDFASEAMDLIASRPDAEEI